jgi:hypothetical protein
MPTRVALYRLQYASNFHISGKISVPFTQYLKPVPRSNLALLGNIGQPNQELAKFFHWCQTQYPSIFWVPGNLELASSEDAKHDIHAKPGILRQWLKKHKLSKVRLLTKTRVDVHSPDLTILGTSMLDEPLEVGGKKLYGYQAGELKPLTKDRLISVQHDEAEWLIRNVQQSYKQCFCLLGNEIRFMPNEWYNERNVRAQLFGTALGKGPSSFTGKSITKEPWIGVNMFGHSGYNPSAFVEIDEIVNESDKLESTIYEQLAIPGPLPRTPKDRKPGAVPAPAPELF